MTYTTRAAAPGSLGFDISGVVSAETAAALYGAGLRFAVRYVARGSTPGSHDISAAEVADLLSAGLGLMLVQRPSGDSINSDWVITAAQGTTYGQNAAAHAKTAGLVAGTSLWCDLEGISSSVSAETVVSYCNNWYAAVSAAGYLPGLYVGFHPVLSGSELYSRLRFAHYWRSGGDIVYVQNRGYQMLQLTPFDYEIIPGVKVDLDVTQHDQKGGAPVWMEAG